jgi:hypothetical protein
MTTRFSGGSMCGAVRYECAADPIAMAASFDDPSWYRPQAEIYTASAQLWDYMNPDLSKFPGLPQK